MAIEVRGAWLGKWNGRAGMLGGDGWEGAGGRLDEGKRRLGVGWRLLSSRDEAQQGERGRRRAMTGLRHRRLCGKQCEQPS
jgi:hypothetical protein